MKKKRKHLYSYELEIHFAYYRQNKYVKKRTDREQGTADLFSYEV